MTCKQTLNIVFGVEPWIVQVELKAYIYVSIPPCWKKESFDDTLGFILWFPYDLLTYPNRVPTYRTSRSSIPIRLWQQRFSCMRGSRAIEQSRDIESSFFNSLSYGLTPALGAPFLASLGWKAKVVLPLLAPVLSAQTILYGTEGDLVEEFGVVERIHVGNLWVPTNAIMTHGKYFIIHYCLF